MKLGDFGLHFRCFSKPVRALRRNRTDVTGSMEKGTLHWGAVHTVLKSRFQSKLTIDSPCPPPGSSLASNPYKQILIFFLTQQSYSGSIASAQFYSGQTHLCSMGPQDPPWGPIFRTIASPIPPGCSHLLGFCQNLAWRVSMVSSSTPFPQPHKI